MSNKVTFATREYVQDEVAKLKLDIDQSTGQDLENLKGEYEEAISGIHNEIESLKETITNDIESSIEQTTNALEDLKESVNNDLENLSRNILVQNIEYTHPEYSQIANVKDVLDRLLYTDLSIDFSTTQTLINEKGTVLTEVIFNWEYNRPVNTQSIDTVTIHKDSRIYRYPTQISTNKNVTLRVNDFVKDFSKSISFKFMNGIYYGVSNSSTYNSELVLGLTKELSETRTKTFTVNAGSDQYIFYCVPESYGTPKFSVGGFDGGFNKVATIDFTNSVNHTEKYTIWKSTNKNLGQTTVTVK